MKQPILRSQWKTVKGTRIRGVYFMEDNTAMLNGMLVCNCANPECMARGCLRTRENPQTETVTNFEVKDFQEDKLERIRARVKELQGKTLLMPGEEIELNILLGKLWD